MISDYFNGFTDVDFKKLLEKGEIKIIDKQIHPVKPTIKKDVSKQTNSKTDSISKQALPPIIDKRTE